MKKLKKANIAVSFSWVFMVIVGVFFLIIAYNIIAKYKTNEEAKLEYQLKDTLQDIFNKFGRTSGTEQDSLASLGNIFRDSRVDILCNDGFAYFSINGGIDTNNDYLQNYPVFMTYIEQGKIDETYMLIESFRLPFKTTNMLAIVSKKNLVVLDENSKIGVMLEKKFKRSSYSVLNYVIFDFNDMSNFEENFVKGKNLNSIVFVTDIGKYHIFPILEGLKVESYLVEIEQQDENDKVGKIKYTDNNGETVSYDFIDYDNSLGIQTMAVFSDPQTFDCSYNLIFKSIISTYDFYIDKSIHYNNLIQKFEKLGIEDGGVCEKGISTYEQKYVYDEITIQLKDIKIEILNNKFINAENLNNNITSLETYMTYNLEDLNCPYLY